MGFFIFFFLTFNLTYYTEQVIENCKTIIIQYIILYIKTGMLCYVGVYEKK